MAFFARALQSDVTDIQHGTAAEGVHLGAMAGSVDQVLRVSTGIEVKGGVLALNPQLPPEMECFEMCIRYRGHSLELHLTRDALAVRGSGLHVPPISLSVAGRISEFASGAARVFQLNDKTIVETE
jgi:trehalose/maltose hydrolase-like predicted phosphorylase